MRIGVSEIGADGGIAGEPELCLMAIGLDQPIGNVVVRDSATGLFASLTRAMDFGRQLIGSYLDVEPAQFESRPTPRLAPAPLARLIAALALVVVVTRDPRATMAAVAGALALAAGARLGRWAIEYARREFVRQWRFALCTLAPAGAFLAWLHWR